VQSVNSKTAKLFEGKYFCIKQINMKKVFTVLLLTMMSSLVLLAQDITASRKSNFNLNDDNVAIKGYDPVAYFKNNAAVKGISDLAVYHQGVVYHFSSIVNKEEFKRNPSKYEPEYGGWCAYAMGAKAEKVSINPETFKLVNGKLYLFYNRGGNNTLTKWNSDESSLKGKADINWKKFFH
jgi:YHS domain-containing protein